MAQNQPNPGQVPPRPQAAETYDYSKDPEFLAAPADQQHGYLMAHDPDYSKASPQDQQAYLAHVNGQGYTDAQLTDGTILRFKGDLDPETVRQKVAQFRANGGQQQTQSTPNPYIQGAENVAIGAGKGMLNTVSGVSTLINKLPLLGKYLAPSEGVQAMKQMAQPQGTAQKVGYYGEQGAEFLAPGVGEDAAGAAAARYLPFLGKAAPMAGRLALNTLGTGAINELQGGSFGTGAAAGAGSGLLGEGIRAVAPKLAETALGVTQRMRSPSKTIGQAVLDETSGFTPGAVAASASQKIASLTGQLNSLAAASQDAASLTPALNVLDDAEKVARSKNSAAMLSKVNALRSQLTTDITTGATIPAPAALSGGVTDAVHPSKILALKRGVGDLVSTWAPQEQKGFQPIVKRVYGALDGELDRTVPGAEQINQRISSLIPAKTRANILSNGASVTQRVAGRMARPTGALAGAGIGSFLGNEYGGKEGALAGGMAGLVAPEILASPTGQMLAARGANTVAPAALPFLKGLALQAARSNPPLPQSLPWASYIGGNQ